MGRVALDRRAVQVADIDALRHLGIQVAADIESRTDRQDAFLVQDRTPLHADLSLDRRDRIAVQAHRRGKGSLTGDRRRGHDEIAVDTAPVILGGHTDREVLEDLPAQPELHLRHVAFALVVVLHAAHIAPHRIGRVVVMVVLRAVAHRTVGRQAEAEAQLARDGHLESDIVEVERIVGRALVCAGHRLRIVVVLPLEAEIEQEGLLRSRTEGRGVEQIDNARRAHGHTDATHRAHRQRTGCILFADAVHRIG